MLNTAQVSKFMRYFVKPGKSILVNKNASGMETFSCMRKTEMVNSINKNGEAVLKEVLTNDTQALLGDASVYISDLAKGGLPGVQKEVSGLFGNLVSVEKTSFRAKNPLGIVPKLERGLEEAPGQTFKNIREAIDYIQDANGARVITKSLDKLSNKEISSMISKMTIDGNKLTQSQKLLLEKYIYQKPINSPEKEKEAFALFEEFARPLVEKRSQEVVDAMTLGILKNRILNEGLTLEKIKSQGFFDEVLIKRLETENIVPIKITEINNYRGPNGLAEFSNRQIHQIVDAIGYNKIADKRLVVYSDARGLDKFNLSEEELAYMTKKSIKKSGYRTAQFNSICENGSLYEIQFRGKYTNMIGEYEHYAYDIRRNKDTLGANFDGFKKAISDLSDTDYEVYNKYLESCYNYYNRLELGLPAVKPKLPKGFNKVLSESSLKHLYEEDKAIKEALEKDFVPYFDDVAA